MAKFWQYLVPIPMGIMEDAEATARAEYNTLLKAYDDLQGRNMALQAERERLTQDSLNIRLQLTDFQTTQPLLHEVQQSLTTTRAALTRRDALLGSLLEKIQAHKGPISNQFKETVARSIYEEWGKTETTETHNGTDNQIT